MVWKPFIDVEEETMECIFQEGPDDISDEEADDCLWEGSGFHEGKASHVRQGEICNWNRCG